MLCCFSSQLIEDCCYLLWTGNIFSFLEKLRMYKRHPHGHGGDKEHYKQAGDGEVEGQQLEGRSHQTLPPVTPKWISPYSILLGTPHFPCTVSLSVEAQVAAGGSEMCSRLFPLHRGLGRLFSWKAQAGRVLQLQQGSSCSAEPASAHAFSHHLTPASQPSGSSFPSSFWWGSPLRDVCVSQGLFLMAQDGARARIPRFCCGSDAVASALSSPPELRVKHAGKGPRKGKLGVC